MNILVKILIYEMLLTTNGAQDQLNDEAALRSADLLITPSSFLLISRIFFSNDGSQAYNLSTWKNKTFQTFGASEKMSGVKWKFCV